MINYTPTPDYYNDYICHYGVKGMKWGKRKMASNSEAAQKINAMSDTKYNELLKNVKLVGKKSTSSSKSSTSKRTSTGTKSSSSSKTTSTGTKSSSSSKKESSSSKEKITSDTLREISKAQTSSAVKTTSTKSKKEEYDDDEEEDEPIDIRRETKYDRIKKTQELLKRRRH